MATLPNITPSGVPATGLPARAGNSRAMRAVRNEAKFRAWLDSAPPSLTELAERELLRQRIEAAVARLIDTLDALDGDPDLEPEGEQDRSDEEPWLGWTGHIDQSAPNRCDSSDRELDMGEAA